MGEDDGGRGRAGRKNFFFRAMLCPSVMVNTYSLLIPYHYLTPSSGYIHVTQTALPRNTHLMNPKPSPPRTTHSQTPASSPRPINTRGQARFLYIADFCHSPSSIDTNKFRPALLHSFTFANLLSSVPLAFSSLFSISFLSAIFLTVHIYYLSIPSAIRPPRHNYTSLRLLKNFLILEITAHLHLIIAHKPDILETEFSWTQEVNINNLFSPPFV